MGRGGGEGEGGKNKTLQLQKQCTYTSDEQEMHVTVKLFDREIVGKQECFWVAFQGVGRVMLSDAVMWEDYSRTLDWWWTDMTTVDWALKPYISICLNQVP